VFPQLVPEDSTFTSYSGFIEIKGEHFKLALCSGARQPSAEVSKFVGKSSGPISGTTVYGCAKLHALLAGSEELLQKRLHQSPTLGAFCLEFKHLVGQLLLRAQTTSSAASAAKLPLAAYYTRLLAEINQIGWDHVTALSHELNRISFRFFDSQKREHNLDLILSADYPMSAPSCNHQLPAKFEPKWNGRNSCLADIFSQFQAQLEVYQEIWRVLDDIDQHTCVVEPAIPLRSDLVRRILISKLLSLRIEFSIQNPLGVPVYSFIGAESAVAPLREKMSSRVHEWDYRKTVRENFAFLTSIEFPAPQPKDLGASHMDVSAGISESEHCAICYGYKLENAIPDQICDNSSCNRAYHAKCLYEWFQSVNPSHRTASTLIWGSCPYCEKKISVRNPQVL
jgi:E3 ubiquitin-protein ligase FANCL